MPIFNRRSNIIIQTFSLHATSLAAWEEAAVCQTSPAAFHAAPAQLRQPMAAALRTVPYALSQKYSNIRNIPHSPVHSSLLPEGNSSLLPKGNNSLPSEGNNSGILRFCIPFPAALHQMQRPAGRNMGSSQLPATCNLPQNPSCIFTENDIYYNKNDKKPPRKKPFYTLCLRKRKGTGDFMIRNVRPVFSGSRGKKERNG